MQRKKYLHLRCLFNGHHLPSFNVAPSLFKFVDSYHIIIILDTCVLIFVLPVQQRVISTYKILDYIKLILWQIIFRCWYNRQWRDQNDFHIFIPSYMFGIFLKTYYLRLLSNLQQYCEIHGSYKTHTSYILKLMPNIDAS